MENQISTLFSVKIFLGRKEKSLFFSDPVHVKDGWKKKHRNTQGRNHLDVE
jgi:hypothetical protein